MNKFSKAMASFAVALLAVSCVGEPDDTENDLNVGEVAQKSASESVENSVSEEETIVFPPDPTPEAPIPSGTSEEEEEQEETEPVEEEEEVVKIASFSNLDDEIYGLLEDGSDHEPGWNGNTESYYEVILSNESLTDADGNVDKSALISHVQWAEAESDRQAQAAEAARQQEEEQARQQQQAPTQQAPPSNTGGSSGGSSSGGSSSSGGGQSEPAPAPEPAPEPEPAPPSGRVAAENVASSVCGANVTWENLGPGLLGLYSWGSDGFKITTREGLASSRLQFVAAHECGHIMQYNAFGGDRQAARDSLNPIYGTSGDMGLEHNAECIAFALGYSDTSLGYVPDCSSGAASAVMSGNRP